MSHVEDETCRDRARMHVMLCLYSVERAITLDEMKTAVRGEMPGVTTSLVNDAIDYFNAMGWVGQNGAGLRYFELSRSGQDQIGAVCRLVYGKYIDRPSLPRNATNYDANPHTWHGPGLTV